ncbi:MAG: PAS domain S-box protein [Snowella sp.]|nr:PAS domain S-box protein [Snowella sp.]
MQADKPVILNNRNGKHSEPILPETIRKGTLLFLADGSLLAQDPEAESILGTSPEQITDWFNLTPNWKAIHQNGFPFTADEHPARLTLQDGRSREKVMMGIEQPNGNLVWLSIDTRPLFQGKTTHPYAVTLLLSELGGHPKSSNALQDSNVVFNTLDESTTVLIFAKDLQGRLLKVNAATLRLLGFNEEELLGKTEFEYIPNPEYAEQIRVNDRYVMDTGQILVCEEFVEDSENGDKRAYLSIKMPYRDGKGDIVGLVGVAADITERRQLEQQLQETNDRLTTILDGMTDAFITLDQDWRITYANQETARLNDVTVDHIIGKKLGEMWPWSIGSIVERNYQKAQQEKQPVHFEFLYDPLDMWLEVHAYPSESGLGIFFRDITERKHVEQALKQSEEKFRCMAEAIPDVFWMTDVVRSQIIYVSPAYEKVWGRSAANLQGNTNIWLESIHPDDRPIVKAATGKCLDHGYNIVEYRIIRPDGSVRWIRDRGYAIREADGQTHRIAGIAEDITERKQEEQGAREQQSLLKLALTAAGAGAWSWEPSTNKVIWSEEYYPLYGLDPKTVTPSYDNWLHCIDPRDRAIADQQAQEALHTGEINVRFRVLHPQGQRWFQTKGQILYDDDGQPLRMVGIAQDITDRKSAEEHLRETADSLALSLSAAKMGYWSWDAHTDSVIFSERGSEIFGILPNQETTWTAILQQLNPVDRQQAKIAVEQSLRDRCDYDIEYRVIRLSDSQEYWVSAKGRARYDDRGQATGMIGVVHDITDRKQAEAQLQQQARDLEQLNHTLKEATNLLTQRNQELDCFVYAVSHDLKAPLRAIINLSEWLEEDLGDRLNPDNQRQMNLLRGRVYKMVHLIDGLLEYSRIGRWETTPEPIAIQDLLGEIVDSIAPPSTFTISIGEDMPTLLTKRLPLTQVFTNLISNAIKHHHRADGHINIRAQDLGQYYEFSVQDDGPGISPQHHERIFKIFQTLKASDNPTSTGIGLTIVKKILETEGGTISVASEVGKGSTFRFTWLVNRDDRI